MQIPRGTFRALKKGIEFSILIEELKAEKFTGYCTINLGSTSILTVHQDGNVLLARYDDLVGDEAWDKIRGLGGSRVDAALSDLTDVQVQLTLEFNLAAKITHPIRIHEHETKSRSSNKVHHDGHPAAPSAPGSPERHSAPRPPAAVKDVNHPQAGRTLQIAAEPVTPKTLATPPGTQSTPATRSHKVEGHSHVVNEVTLSSKDEFILVNKDLDALDTMDLDSMTRKIKGNCQLIIKKLNLEHLMERNEH